MKEESTEQLLAQINKHFYCEACHKQYYNNADFEEHNNSYGHHHKKVPPGLRPV